MQPRVLILFSGLFDKGGIARYGRYQVRAVREWVGAQNVAVFSLLGPDIHSLEEELAVAWHGPSVPTLASRSECAARVLSRAARWRPELVVSGHVNLGPLAWSAAAVGRGRLVQNIYGLEVWSGLSRIRRASLRAATTVISDCENTAEVAARLSLTRSPPEVVWDCVDTERFSPGEARYDRLSRYGLMKTRRLRVLFLGRVTEDSRYKGFERLLEVIHDLPESEFEAVISGGGDYLDALRDRVSRDGLDGRVLITGRVHEDDLVDVYRAADVFYLVSESGPGMGEGLPLTPIEAMACGVPAIVGDQDGSREIIAGAGGRVFSPRDVTRQREYLLELRRNPELLAAERRASRARVLDAFRYDSFAEKTVRALETALR